MLYRVLIKPDKLYEVIASADSYREAERKMKESVINCPKWDDKQKSLICDQINIGSIGNCKYWATTPMKDEKIVEFRIVTDPNNYYLPSIIFKEIKENN